MDINNYFNLKKLNNSYINKQVNDYCISDINGRTLEDHLTLEKVNEYLNEVKKNNIIGLKDINVEKRTFIEVLPKSNYWNDPTTNYTEDILKYIELFLFRRIKVMSIVNLIMNGNYFTNEFRHINLTDLINWLNNNYSWDDETSYLEQYSNEFDNYDCITGMCNNFKKLQFIE